MISKAVEQFILQIISRKVASGAISLVMVFLLNNGCMNSNISRTATKKKSTSQLQFKVPEFSVLAPFSAEQVRTLSLNNPDPNAAPNSRVFAVDVKLTPASSSEKLVDYCSGSGSPCECVFIVGGSYIRAPVLLTESNMIRCDGSIVASAPTSIEVMVHFNNEGITTNSIPFTPSNQTANYSNPSAFEPIIRHQCYRETFIPYFSDTDLIDPIQSNDPKQIIYYNYYTNNLGRTGHDFAERSKDYGLNSTQANQSFPSQNVIRSEIFHCPDLMGYAKNHQSPSNTEWDWFNRALLKGHPEGMLPGNPDVSTFSGYNVFPLHDPRPLKINGQTLTRDPDSKYRSWTTNEMSSFHLARTAGGAYTEPVFAVQYPQLSNDLGSVDNPNKPIQPIGFAVLPQSVDSDMICPSDNRWPSSQPVIKPIGFEWKKLWQATSSKEPFKRKRIRSQPANLGSIQEIFCNPGVFIGGSLAPSGQGRSIIPACAKHSYDSPGTPFQVDFFKDTEQAISSSSGSLAARFFYGVNRCYTIGSGTKYAPFNNYSGGQFGGSKLNDSQQALLNAFDIQNSSEVALEATEESIDKEPANDWLFFVTEPTVQRNDIESQKKRYQLIRVGSIEGCVQALGGNPSLGTILADYDNFRLNQPSECKWITYTPAFSSVEENPVVPISPDNPGGDRRTPATYPLCVLQPTDEGLRL